MTIPSVVRKLLFKLVNNYDNVRSRREAFYNEKLQCLHVVNNLVGTRPFNRGQLLNVGFLESQKMGSWECFVFHDVDLLPLDGRNLYQCDKQPRHMSAAIDAFGFELPYNNLLGGVLAMTLELLQKVNGFSKRYWGWGGEDDDMFHRLWMMGYRITRYNMSVARYIMLGHSKAVRNPRREDILRGTKNIVKMDGISSQEYVVIKRNFHPLYTHIIVDIDRSRYRQMLKRI